MRQIGEYIITDLNISKGAFATIHKGYHKYSKLPVAIKEIQVTNIHDLKPFVKRELEIHKKIMHPNIVKLYDIIINHDENKIYMIMEFCYLGDLHKFQNKKILNENYIQHYMIQLRDALKYLLDNNIVHRDLKPQNILLSDIRTIKITDFGLARYCSTNNDIEEDLFSTYCGSPMYMSPEILLKNNYSSKSDLWSVGIILYEMITGNTPIHAKNIEQLKTKINTINIDLTLLHKFNISSDCYDLLLKLLDKDKSRRITWNEFFNHPWFTSNNLLNYDNYLIENPLEYDNITKHQIFTTLDDEILNTKQSVHEKKTSRILNNFTFTLKSSLFSSNNSSLHDSNEQLEIPKNVNLSDLKQDDIEFNKSYNPSKPINIIGKKNYHIEHKTPDTTPSSTSSNLTTGLNNSPNINNNTSSVTFSPRSFKSAITNGFKFIKETYEYLNNDTNSI
jgi:serine/threonine protein kinase